MDKACFAYIFIDFTGLIVLNYFDFVSGYAIGGWFFLGLGITGIYLKKVNDLSSHTSKIQSTFEQFHKLILEIENENFSSEILSKKRNSVVESSIKASTSLKEFAKYLDVLDQRRYYDFRDNYKWIYASQSATKL